MASTKTYFVITDRGRWGPVPWQNLRRWLALGWLPKEMRVSDSSDAGEVQADYIERFWKISDRPFTAKDPSEGMEDAGGPITLAMRRRLVDELGWPGAIELNYFNCDHLRLELEKIFLATDRAEFRDPEWPKSLKRDRFAEARIWGAAHDAVPATESQMAVLSFFGKRTDGVTKGDASKSIEALFAVPGNKDKWEQHRGWSAEPATDRQLLRLRFAASWLKRQMPDGLSKQAAHDLIDEWFQGRPELQDAYAEHKAELEEREIAADIARIKSEDAAELAVVKSASQKPVSPPARSGCAGMILVVVLTAGLAIAAKHLL